MHDQERLSFKTLPPHKPYSPRNLSQVDIFKALPASEIPALHSRFHRPRKHLRNMRGKINRGRTKFLHRARKIFASVRILGFS